MMRAHLQRLAAALSGLLRESEGFTLWLEAERTDFVRFNHGKVRQAGEVKQAYLDLRLIRGKRQATQQLSLSGGMRIWRWSRPRCRHCARRLSRCRTIPSCC
ncbi:Uncharacterised protein [Chromobacterium violaceum]|uniref:Uncharacterized protein n=1 Tax=Chromobacterium violaceum TaxID=536 RepID=A0A3S4LLC0_CHRVL|nr:Uncharacterised protein [Chromobacterium violaceum]